MNSIVNKILQTTRKLWLEDKALDKAAEVNRRQFIGTGRRLTLLLPVALPPIALHVNAAQSQTQPTRLAAQNAITVAQLVDMSTTQQDVAKDFLIGSRAAWQDINARGGIRGRPVSHWVLETDGSESGAKIAWDQARDNSGCIALSGTAADPLTNQLNAFLRAAKADIAHVAPWQQNASVELDANTFTIFSSRDEQIAHALKFLSTLRATSLGVVFASKLVRQQNIADVQHIAQKSGFTLQEQALTSSLVEAGQNISASSAAVILFIGGTPELAQFTRGLEQQARLRYVLALADVNLQTLQQMGAAKSIPIIVTQAVPLVNSALPIVRSYRQVLAKLYDEPPTPLGLAGFIAAKYTHEVIQGIEGQITRASVLQAFNRRQNVDVGGYRVVYTAQKRGSAYVTQSMLGADGRVIG
jgi:ABC-type branched-subunit amino acid transport system substrate-binding protein